MRFAKPLAVGLGVAAFFFFSTAVCADIVFLKNKNQLEGEVIETSEDALTLQMNAGQVRLAKDDIINIVEAPFVRIAPRAPDADKSFFERYGFDKGKKMLKAWQKMSDKRKVQWVDTIRGAGITILSVLLLIRHKTRSRPRRFGE